MHYLQLNTVFIARTRYAQTCARPGNVITLKAGHWNSLNTVGVRYWNNHMINDYHRMTQLAFLYQNLTQPIFLLGFFNMTLLSWLHKISQKILISLLHPLLLSKWGTHAFSLVVVRQSLIKAMVVLVVIQVEVESSAQQVEVLVVMLC